MRHLTREPFDLEALKVYLSLRYVPSPRSIFAGETVDSDARVLMADELGNAKPAHAERGLSEEILSTCKSIISSLLHDKSRICVVTSGGIDSSATVATMSMLGLKFEAVTMGFDGPNDEIQDAELLCDRFGVRLHKFVSRSVLSSTSEALSKLRLPYRGAGYCYDLAKYVKSLGFETVVDALGVDEFFGGYGFRYLKTMQLRDAGMDELSAYVRGAHPLDFVEEKAGLFGSRLGGIVVPWSKYFPYFENDLPFLEQIFLADYNGKCVYNFIPLSSVYKVFGVEPVYPWLSDAFIDLSLRIPSQLKYDPQTGKTKIAFRKAFEPYLPAEAFLKKKQGFGPDIDTVWQRELKDATEDVVLGGYMVSHDYLDRNFFEATLKGEKLSALQMAKCWEVYSLERMLEVRGIA